MNASKRFPTSFLNLGAIVITIDEQYITFFKAGSISYFYLLGVDDYIYADMIKKTWFTEEMHNFILEHISTN